MTATREAVKLLTYPPRPLNSGPLPLAGKKFGRWLTSCKYNGWRICVHTPTGTCFNRKGERLTIASEFADVLKWLQVSRFEWLDCEGLERRHGLARGSLIVLDSPIKGTAQERFEALSIEIPIHNYLEKPPANSLLLAGQMELAAESTLDLWKELQELNTQWGVEFWEGIVQKKLDSPYPIQTRDPERKCPFWTKSRWKW